MKNELKVLREEYQRCKVSLGFVNKQNFTSMTKSIVMSDLNYARHALAREIKRVSWLVWPETGRPQCLKK